MWSPFEIKTMLFYYCQYGDYEHRSAPIHPEIIQRLVGLGLLQTSLGKDREFEATPLGIALVQAWEATPIPIIKYVDPRFERA